jgi:hypothetical protein
MHQALDSISSTKKGKEERKGRKEEKKGRMNTR